MRADIKAIETVYKGYRFRSRLEARWAVFFDAMGLEWTYEAQGFDLDGKRYLPDFYLTSLGMHVEVKPGKKPPYARPFVYMAGRMGAQNYRPFCIETIDIDEIHKSPPVVDRCLDGFKIAYTGPFATTFEDHCEFHGFSDCFIEDTEDQVLFNSRLGVDRCDVFFAIFEDFEAFGTLVELGWAHAKSKHIVIGFVGEQFRGRDPVEQIGGVRGRGNPLWFAARAANTVLVGDRAQVLREFKEHLETHYPTPREIDLIDRLNEAGEKACIVYGDPVDAFADQCANIYQPGYMARYPTFMRFGHERREAAATKARQARFEHGASG
jgi:hypothetical protein